MKPLGKFRPSPCILHGLGYLALALILAGWGVRLTLAACGGEWTPPLDDTYIYFGYAAGAARGEPFVYQAGADPTRGATSLLYPLVLAPWARFGGRGALGPAALILGVLGLAGAAWGAHSWASRRWGGGAGWGAGLLVLGSGHFVWGALSGMDIALYAVLLATSVAAVPWALGAPDAPRGARRLGVLGLLLTALALARPEGILLAGVIAGGVVLARSSPNSRRGRGALLLAPALAAALTAGADVLATGHLVGNSALAKAVWLEPRPDLRGRLLARLPWVLGQISLELFSDFKSSAFGHGTGGILWGGLLLGAGAGAVHALSRRGSAAERILLAVVAAALLSGLAPVGFNSHHLRYQIPYVPCAAMLVVSGWWALGTLAGRRPWVPVGALVILLLPNLARFEGMLAANAGNIHDQQVATGRWIREHLPENARVALNDAGAIPWFGGRASVDLVGLITNGPAIPNRAGPGSLFEWLEDLPPDRRPTHFAIFPSWFPYLRRTSLVGKKLEQFTLANNTISGSDVEGVFVADWDRTRGGDEVWIRRRYRAFDAWKNVLREFEVAGIPGRVLIDGGLVPDRGERFVLHARPGVPGALVMRTESYREFTLRVRVGGRDLGTTTVPSVPTAWSEPLIQIPGDAITGDTLAVEITLEGGTDGYPSYHYWLLQ
jgi:hypothetical protein